MDMSQALRLVLSDPLLPLAVPLFLAVIALEFWWARRRAPEMYLGRDTRASLWLGAITVMIEVPCKAASLVVYTALHEVSPLRDVVGRQWWAWLLLFFADDLTYYVLHRTNHEVRLLWAGHVPHHSSVYLNFGTALRQGPGERLHKFLFWAWLPLAGFDGLMVHTMITISLIYQFFVHTQLVDRLPAPIEWFFNTPSHHRAHHAANVRYLDRNHGGILIIWDRLFGTFSEEAPSDPPRYGLTKNVASYQPVFLSLHEYLALLRDVRRASGLMDKLRYVFLAPGWSHDGPDMRANTLRRGL